MENLVRFATDDRIIRLVAKERGKYADKSNGRGETFKSDPLFQLLKGMTPPHRLWSDPGRWELPRRGERGVAKWTSRKKRATVRVFQAVKKYRDKMPDAPWVQNLNAFIASVRAVLASEGPLVLETPRTIPKIKDKDYEAGVFTYRPISRYRDLTTKIVLALSYQYIVTYFDRYFHPYMLYMRGARPGADGKYKVPAYTDAIEYASAYRACHDAQNIYVGECDIQKFYDTFNHDVIVDCFENLFDEVKRKENVADAEFDPLRRVVRAYLDSYNYPEHVLTKNDDPDFWKREQGRWRKKHPNPVCRFKWVDEDDFVESGCYTEEEFRAARDGGKLGVPQGGALSGIIVNVIMRVVDQPVVGREDPDRFFIRYCDDILLMHTSYSSCSAYLDAYYEKLIQYKLIPHPRKDVSEFKNGKKTGSGFWHSKSKNVYRWGPGPGNASDWVAFVGYEMRRTGEIRLRKDKVDSECRRIARCYNDIIHTKAVKSGEAIPEERQRKLMARMEKLADHILDSEKAGNNRYSRAQARHMDKYLYGKSLRVARKLQIADAREAARSVPTYLSRVIQKQEDGHK